jgi:hypothetical protein
MDESGYTGFDLLNSDQRFQGAAAISITNEQAECYIRRHFPILQGPELKYKAISKKINARSRAVSLISDVLQNHECVICACDKRFLLALMFVEYAVEPYYYRKGFDFYKDGQNHAMASMLYKAGSVLIGDTAYWELMHAFQNAMKVKTQESVTNLISAIRTSDWRKIPEILGPLAELEDPDCISAITQTGITTDAALPITQAIVSQTEIKSSGSYIIEHDESKNLENYNTFFNRMLQIKDDAEFKISEIAGFKFPLKLKSVNQVRSETSYAVQIADFIIGSAVDSTKHFYTPNTNAISPQELAPLYRDG